MNEKYGKIIIENKSAPLSGLVLLIVSAAFILGIVFGVRPGTMVAVHYLVLVLFSLLAIFGVKLLIKPLLMSVITENGVLFYYHKNASLSQEVFIPWENISSLQLVERRVSVGTRGGTTTKDMIEARIINKAALSIPKRMFNLSDPETIDIDANPIFPAGKDLLDIIASIPKVTILQQSKKTFSIR